MAEKEEKSDKFGIKIPVLSVLTNGRALKNIFLAGPGGELREEYESMPILIGRHPDCHVTLDHPSISRFHLEIFAKPSIQKISVVDRTSVHGTWVSGNKIEPNIPVDLKEGDVLRIGASTREYRFHWLSLNEAYEMENPLPPLIEEKEETHQEEICQEVLTNQDEISSIEVCEEPICLKLEKVQQHPIKTDLADTILILGPVLSASECTRGVERASTSSLLLDSVGSRPISDEDLPESVSTRSFIKGDPASLLSNLAAPPELESTGSVLSATASILLLDSSTTDTTSEPGPPASESVKSIRKGTPSSLLSRRSKSITVSSLSIQTGRTKEKAQQEEIGGDVVEKCVAKEVELENEEIFESDKENMTPASSYGKRSKACRRTLCNMGETKQHTGLALNSSSKLVRKGVKKGAETLSVFLNSREILSEAKENGSCASTKEKVIQELFTTRSAKKSGKTVCILGETNLIDESSSKVLHKNENSHCTKEGISLQVSVSKSAKKSHETVHAVGRTKKDHRSVPQVLFENCEENGNFASNKENVTPIFSSTECKYRPVLKSPERALFQNVISEGAEEENCDNFGSDKENCTPDSRMAKKMRHPHFEDSSVVENEIGERKETERVPFQVLFDSVRAPSSSPLRSLCTDPDNSSVVKFSLSIKDCRTSLCGPLQQVKRENTGEPRKEWIMIVDTGCLLGDKSIKAIKLLQGLRGTRLIIPRIVIRELDCMKRREGLFRRPNKLASLVLEWIEECMEREPLWIHVQSSAETLPVAPTPPVTPTSLFCDAGSNLGPGFRPDLNMILSPSSSFMEIVTPTSDDHVLECALLFKKLRGDAKVVILSSSTTLKIKAMAEGLLCEEAKDFRDSLTNPLSKRFMWASISSSGPSCSLSGDGVAISDNLYKKNNNPVIARRAFKAAEAIKGLKLILHHNSNYAQTSLVN
ncbi:hypothetical protein LUZ62_077016 [Rhynchospora pubera]|uniref:FHA domain-containing protein n=1 Tax=Rhynchospora pubera TaxID=906938 RepID=A0AAV8DGX5_9POAL|nr:hypothetical protein LUZ62_077016 [Rhynchospora pubera]